MLTKFGEWTFSKVTQIAKDEGLAAMMDGVMRLEGSMRG